MGSAEKYLLCRTYNNCDCPEIIEEFDNINNAGRKCWQIWKLMDETARDYITLFVCTREQFDEGAIRTIYLCGETVHYPWHDVDTELPGQITLFKEENGKEFF